MRPSENPQTAYTQIAPFLVITIKVIYQKTINTASLLNRSCLLFLVFNIATIKNKLITYLI